MTFRVDNTMVWHVRAVVSALREADLAELRAIDPDITVNAIVDTWLALLPRATLAATYLTPDGTPAAILQIIPTAGSAGIANVLATPDFRTIGGAVTAHMLADVRPDMIARGFRRIEARVHSRHKKARLWLRRLGARAETVVRGLAVDGSEFVQMAWVPTKQEIDDVLGQA